MNAKHNLKFIEAAVLQLRSEVMSDVALLETLLKDPTAATARDDLVGEIAEIALRCVANEQAASFLRNNMPAAAPTKVAPTPVDVEEDEEEDDMPGPVGTPPSRPRGHAITEKELRKRSPTFRKSINESPAPPTQENKEE